MTSNLQEFLIVGALVGGVTTFMLGFRLTSIHLENEAREYIKKKTA